MTEKSYYKDSYINKAQCEVEAIECKAGKTEVVLKETPFYPEGGGQPCDLGTIGELMIDHVYEENDLIYHVLTNDFDCRTLNKGDIVECIVDMKRRFDHIQQHSGEHLLSAAFFKLFKGINAGFHLGEDYITIDINLKDMDSSMIRNAELEANSYIYENKAVKTYFLSKDEALQLPLRKELKAEGNIRIVEMGDGIDYSACCGTHVKLTGEVGLIKVLKHENYKGMTRIYFKCGQRAFNDYINKHDCMVELAQKFSTDASDVLTKVTLQTELISELKQKVTALTSKIALKEAGELIKTVQNGIIYSEYDDEGFEFIEKIYEQLKNDKFISVLCSRKEKRILFGQNGFDHINCGLVFKNNLKLYNGRGGGNDKRAQASFESNDSMDDFMKHLLSLVK